MDKGKTVQEALNDHLDWIKSGGKEGVQFNLSGEMLAGANMSGADLQEVDLRKANLNGADLKYTQISWKSLSDGGFVEKIQPSSASRSR